MWFSFLNERFYTNLIWVTKKSKMGIKCFMLPSSPLENTDKTKETIKSFVYDLVARPDDQINWILIFNNYIANILVSVIFVSFRLKFICINPVNSSSKLRWIRAKCFEHFEFLASCSKLSNFSPFFIVKLFIYNLNQLKEKKWRVKIFYATL